jgi:methylated-DNA-[protein]-cysteine S-methyltransferase
MEVEQNLYFFDTPVGRLGIVENGVAITEVFFENENRHMDIRLAETKLLKEAGRQLQEYFACKRKVFDLPLEPKGHTIPAKGMESTAGYSLWGNTFL